MAPLRVTPAGVLLLAGGVLASSWLGLTARPTVESGSFDGSWEFFVEVWTASLLADAMFVGGSVGAFLGMHLLASRWHPLAVAALGVGAHQLVYWLSFLLLPHGEGMGALESFRFVFDWGWPGLVFAALAAPALAVWGSRNARKSEPAAG